MDGIDRKILDILLQNGRISHEEIGRILNLSRPAVRSRIVRMEESGTIRGYRAELDWARLGRELNAFVFVKGSGPAFRKVAEKIQDIRLDEVTIQRISRISGEWCMLVEVRTSKTQHLNAFIDKLWEIECIRETSTSFVLSDYQADSDAVQRAERSEESCVNSD